MADQTEQKATNITRHENLVTRAERAELLGRRGLTLWFTGLSASGKSTVAMLLERELLRDGVWCYVLDGDNIRQGLCKNLGFSPEDRAENMRRIGEVAKLFADAGLIAVASFISPYQKDRAAARASHDAAGIPFVECYVNTSLEDCEKRDPKGLYKKARAGQIKGFTGIDDPYEAPENPELIIAAGERSVEECVRQIRDYLTEKKYL